MAITYGDSRIDRGDYDPPNEETIPLDGYYDIAPEKEQVASCCHWPGQRRCSVCGMGYSPEERRT